jgi:transposase
MDVLHPRCCGLDVHKNSISACILEQVAGRVQKHQRRFGAMTQDLQELANWLRQFEVTQVAMESSGVYWKPVWNILEGQFTVVLANAQHIKNVPGRKTDQKDAKWIAQLLQHGLLRPSYVPCEVIRDLRDLTECGRVYRKKLRVSAAEFRKCLRMPTLNWRAWPRTHSGRVDEPCWKKSSPVKMIRSTSLPSL